MNLLRRSVRQQQTGGGWIYATVEESVYGYATVRLATNGARMTNLPVLTARVSEGEKVIVDYSAEGQPYVRPITALSTEADEPVAEGVPEVQEDSGLIAARLTRTSRYPFTAYYWVPFGEGYTVPKVVLPMDKVAWETQEGLCQIDAGGGFKFRAPEDGKYLVRWCIGIETTSGAPKWDGNVVVRIYTQGWVGGIITSSGGRIARRYVAQAEDGVGVVVASGTTLVQLAPGSGFINETVDILVQVECEMPTYWDTDPPPYIGQDTAYAYKEGCYPVLEVWKIAQTGGVLEANFNHIWWQYW